MAHITTRDVQEILKQMVEVKVWPEAFTYQSYRQGLCNESPKLTACVKREYANEAIFMVISSMMDDERQPKAQKAVHRALAERLGLQMQYKTRSSDPRGYVDDTHAQGMYIYLIEPPFPEGLKEPGAVQAKLRQEAISLAEKAPTPEMARFVADVNRVADAASPQQPRAVSPADKPPVKAAGREF